MIYRLFFIVIQSLTFHLQKQFPLIKTRFERAVLSLLGNLNTPKIKQVKRGAVKLVRWSGWNNVQVRMLWWGCLVVILRTEDLFIQA